mmetsp:Transcript_73169/g.161493  ORF Transcript_73169/g.161493 Transcript_73169/m.161493 type:complete len:258 (+) Transcript_73169:1544-2317(+)
MVVFHVIRGKSLHPVDQGRLLDDVHSGIEVESRLRRLEISEVQIGIGQAVFSARQHASVDKFIPGQLPLAQHAIKVHPIEVLLTKVQHNHHRFHAIQEQTWWPKNGLYNTLLSKMCQLRTRKVRGLDALIAAVSQVVENEIHEVAIDSAGGDREALLRQGLFATRQVVPGHVHLLIHAVGKHGVLWSWCHTLKNEEWSNSILFKGIQLFVHEAKDPRRDAPQGIGKGILQGLNGSKPENRIDPHMDTAELIELAGIH